MTRRQLVQKLTRWVTSCGFLECYTTERKKETPEELEVRFFRLNTGRATIENIKPYNPTTVDWCIPKDMKEGDYLRMDPAFEVNEKGGRERIDGNEALEKKHVRRWTWILIK